MIQVELVLPSAGGYTGCLAAIEAWTLPHYTGTMLAAIRFIWNATRGSRLRPWRSPYVRWRIETYSGLHAETLTGWDVLRFTWRERRQLLRFLHWTSEINVRKKAAHEN